MLIDATRIMDGKRVMLKRIAQNELEIAAFFKYSHETITHDPRNHCIPIFDVLEVPDEEGTAIIAIPFLRPFYSPRFETRGELLEFFRQILEVRTPKWVWVIYDSQFTGLAFYAYV